MIIEMFYSRSLDGWTAVVDGACGSGATAWAALAEALEVWERRGKPAASSEPVWRGGPAWVVERAIARPSGHYRYHVEGINLNIRPGADGRRFSWDVPDLNADQYELLCTIDQETANV
jgi:hypothetical protein